MNNNALHLASTALLAPLPSDVAMHTRSTGHGNAHVEQEAQQGLKKRRLVCTLGARHEGCQMPAEAHDVMQGENMALGRQLCVATRSMTAVPQQENHLNCHQVQVPPCERTPVAAKGQATSQKQRNAPQRKTPSRATGAATAYVPQGTPGTPGSARKRQASPQPPTSPAPPAQKPSTKLLKALTADHVRKQAMEELRWSAAYLKKVTDALVQRDISDEGVHGRSSIHGTCTAFT